MEKNLLLYLETCAVDRAGIVDSRRMNDEEFKLAEYWSSQNFIEFGRIRSDFLKRDATHWVRLSPQAFDLAHYERKCRAKRMWLNRHYRKTGEVDSTVDVDAA